MKRRRSSMLVEEAEGRRSDARQEGYLASLILRGGEGEAAGRGSKILLTHAQESSEHPAGREQHDLPSVSAGDGEEEADQLPREYEAGPSRSRSCSRSTSSSNSASSHGSLFSSRSPSPSPPAPSLATTSTYARTCPPIPGLYLFPSLLSLELERELLRVIDREGYFSPLSILPDPRIAREQEREGGGGGGGGGAERNQAMLFGRARPRSAGTATDGQEWAHGWSTGLPKWADELVLALGGLLKGHAQAQAQAQDEDARGSCAGTDTEGSSSRRSTTAAAALPQEVWEMLFPECSSSTFPSPSIPTSGSQPQPQPHPSPHPRPPPHLQSRQLILNRYHPPQGLASHIDLPHRFADGIVLCSLSAGIGMRFRPRHRTRTRPRPLQDGEREREPPHPQPESYSHTHHLYLPARSVLVLSGEARWEWEHGIEESWGDWVERDGEDGGEGECELEGEEKGQGEGQGSTERARGGGKALFIPRQERKSITIRFMKEGADCVGE
ncbi:hypothetical protein BCV69DRAFT_44715 [Microstroma glucosiphilum]|uniref:Fe2OG dioxygenase domain-containing protein n=1 Tax=Pseudomicrostroma glucosiphilum TaxID=1684307 RepID=A0A316U3R0_9BASI|nr:hypothetical protein BCV69DRAFT_44715 [Pseudomicrostroma glucosiphilum]PWN19111.1 hypothetical protein BCV69DRAFT_44715 [Pseudomicrostroma glucosiphilum]